MQGVLWAETDFVWCLGGGDVLYCPTATTVAVRSADGARNKELCFTLSPIQCLAANPLFRTFVVATLDGTVSAHSLVNGRHVVQNKLSGIVGLVLTLRICLVVVFREANVSVLNVSGEMMKTVEFSRRIVTAFAVSSAGDIDFVVVQTDGLQLGFFEAFYPETFVELATLHERVVCATYSQPLRAFLVVTESGVLRVMRHSLDINPPDAEG
jgi:hypothetical protein